MHSDRETALREEPGLQGGGVKLIVAAFLATMIEWMDYFAYGIAAALVFGTVFFPGFSPLAGTLAAFSTFAVGFLARPVGALFFSHFGDRYGRKPTLVTATILMAVASFLVGVLPSYAAIGVAAPIILVVLRLLQGFSAGGQWGGVALLLTEHAPEGRRGFYGSFMQAGTAGGFIPANLFFLVAAGALSPEAFASWGWRIPFLASAVLIGVALYIQLRIEETPAFRRLQEQQGEVGRRGDARYRTPILEIFRTHLGSVLLGGGSVIGVFVWYYYISAGMVDYVSRVLGVATTTILSFLIIATVFQVTCAIAFGALSDRVGRRPVYLSGLVLSMLWAFPLFWLADTGSLGLIFVAIAVAFALHGVMISIQAAILSELFSTEVRYSGVSMGYQLGAAFGGGFAPLISAGLLGATGTTASVSLYLIAMLAITLVCVYLMSETAHSSLSPGTSAAETPQATGDRA